MYFYFSKIGKLTCTDYELNLFWKSYNEVRNENNDEKTMKGNFKFFFLNLKKNEIRKKMKI